MVESLIRRARRWRSGTPSVEIHIPISPTPTFFNMVQCLTLSLRQFGGICRDAPVILTVGDSVNDPTISDRYPWLGPLGVELRWVSESDFRSYSYYATGTKRLLHDFRSDLVLLLDADILIARPFDELLDRTQREQHVAGMIAPASPLQFFKEPTTWQQLYDHCGIQQAVDLTYDHPGWPYYCSPELIYRKSPIYFNYGVICAPADAIKKIGESYFKHLLRLRELTTSDLIAQIALTMAILEQNLPTRALPVRYNFPNHPMMEALHGNEIQLARFLHLKEQHQFDKFNLFTDLAHVRATIKREDLRGINEVARQVLKAIESQLVDTTTPARLAG